MPHLETDHYNVHTGLPAAERLLRQVTTGAMAQKQADARRIAELTAIVREFTQCDLGGYADELCARADALLARLDAEQLARETEPLKGIEND